MSLDPSCRVIFMEQCSYFFAKDIVHAEGHESRVWENTFYGRARIEGVGIVLMQRKASRLVWYVFHHRWRTELIVFLSKVIHEKMTNTHIP